jgi:hypothetical protein
MSIFKKIGKKLLLGAELLIAIRDAVKGVLKPKSK